jgi:RNA polymerase sigma-70 factor (sigma-E family)
VVTHAPEGFEDRFDELAALAYRIGYRLLGDREEARDVAQEAMARAYARWRRVSRYPDPWVSRVATNLSLGILRRRREPAQAPDPATHDHTDAMVDRELLADALERLPRRQREVVVLRYIADRSEADVARALGCSVGTVKSHAHRGLGALRAQLATTPIGLAGGTA